MTTKQKRTLPNPRKITFELTVKKVRMPQPELLVPYTTTLKAHKDDGKELIKIANQLDELFTAKSDIFSMTSEVKLVLETMEIERNAKGKKQRGPDGRWQGMPFDIKTQRLINMIITPIYDKIDEWDEENEGKHKNMKLKIAPKYAIYLCDRMIEQCSEYTYTAGHIVEMYDYFLLKKAEAEMVEKMIKTGASDEEIDKAIGGIILEDVLEEDKEDK